MVVGKQIKHVTYCLLRTPRSMYLVTNLLRFDVGYSSQIHSLQMLRVQFLFYKQLMDKANSKRRVLCLPP